MSNADQINYKISQAFLETWQDVHGFSAGSANVLMGPQQLVIIIDGAFSRAERNLAKNQSGKNLLITYTNALLQQISDTMVVQVEQTVERQVLTHMYNVNIPADQVMFSFQLAE